MLESSTQIAPDSIKAGLYRYVYGDWEMVYNPISKEVWHIQPIKKYGQRWNSFLEIESRLY